MQERGGGDVDQRVRRAQHDEEGERGSHVGPGREQDQGNAPEDDARAEHRRQPAAAQQREHEEQTRDRAHAHGRVEEADAGGAEIQELERRDDDEHPQHARGERLAPVEGDNRSHPPVGRDRAKSREGLAEDARLAPGRHRSGRRCAAVQPADEDGRQAERRRRRREDGADAGGGQEEPSECGPDEEPDALQRRRGRVRGRQLLRRAGQGRQQRGLRRLKRRARDRDEARQRVHDLRRRVRERSRGRAGHRSGAHEIGGDHDAIAAVPVAEQSREGRDQGRRKKPDERHDPDGCRAAGAVREDRECHLVSPLAEDRSAPRELESPQLRVSEDGGERVQRRTQTRSCRNGHAARMARAFAFLNRQAEDCTRRPRLEGGSQSPKEGPHGGRQSREAEVRERGERRRRRGAQVRADRRRAGEVEVRDRRARGRRGAQVLARAPKDRPGRGRTPSA